MTNAIIRCRKCGKPMKSEKINHEQVRLSCSCGFAEFKNLPDGLHTINPFKSQPLSFATARQSDRNEEAMLQSLAGRMRKEIQSLWDLSFVTSSDLPLAEKLDRVAAGVVNLLKAKICTIYTLNATGSLVMAATCGFDRNFVGKLVIMPGEGITGTVFETGEHIALSQASLDPRYKQFPELNEEKYNSMLSCPVFINDSVAGVININNTSMRVFSEDEITFIHIVSHLVSTAIQLD